MALFGSKPKGLDAGSLNRLNEENYQKQKQIIGGVNPALQPINAQFESRRKALSSALLPTATSESERFGRDLEGINTLEQRAGKNAAINFREQQFRQVPQLTRSIQEALGASGMSGNAVAAARAANPVLDAATASRDFESSLEQQLLNNRINRAQDLASTKYGARTQALESQFGLDKDTIDYLTGIGREDIIREAAGMLGAEEQFGANRLGIEQARQANEIARASAGAAKRGNIISGLSSLSGAGLGFALSGGNPLVAALGGQLGGTVGNVANGAPSQFDPSLLFMLNQRRSGPSQSTLNFVRA